MHWTDRLAIAASIASAQPLSYIKNGKMKIVVTIILIIAAALEKLMAQYIPLVEESKYWIYYDFQARPRPTTGFLITIKGDTILNGMLYKKVYKYELTGELKSLAINEPLQFVADFPYNLQDKELISLLREDYEKKLVFNLPINKDSCIDQSSGTINPCNDIIFCDENDENKKSFIHKKSCFTH